MLHNDTQTAPELPEPSERPLHIALLSRSVLAHHLGGMEAHGEALRRWLAMAGHRVTTLTTAAPQGPDTVEDSWGVTYHLPNTASGRYSSAWDVAVVERLHNLHTHDAIDVIASQSAAAFPYLAQRNRQVPEWRIPTVLMNQGTVVTAIPDHLRGVLRHPARAVFKQLPADARNWWNDRHFYPLAAHIIALSGADKAAISRWLAVPQERVSVIPNGVDTALFSPSPTARAATRARLGLDDGEIAVGIVASLEPRKGQHVMLAALADAALCNLPRAIRLVLIGDGPSRDLLHAQARRLGLEQRVTFLGPRPQADVPALLNGLDIIAVPSFTEGMPLSLLEAMACARPVIASRVGAAESVITQNVTGLLVPIGDSAALARAVEQLARNPNDAQRLGERARVEVMERHEASSVLRSYERTLLRAAAQGQQRPQPSSRPRLAGGR